jgi:hypothetical protein
MSKLADRIKKIGRAEPQRIGFTATPAAPGPSLLVVVSLDVSDAGKAGEIVNAGADVLVFGGELKKGGAYPPGSGLRGESLGRAAVSAAREAGADFVLIGTRIPSESLLEEGIGFVLELPEDADDTRLRLLGDLNLDAIVVQAPPEPLTLESLLGLRRVASLTRTPLLASVETAVSGTALHALRESGVVGVIVTGASAADIGALRERILALPPRGRRRDNGAEALLPAQAVVGGGEDDYDDDDD